MLPTVKKKVLGHFITEVSKLSNFLAALGQVHDLLTAFMSHPVGLVIDHTVH